MKLNERDTQPSQDNPQQNYNQNNSQAEVCQDHPGYTGSTTPASSQGGVPTQHTDTLTWNSEHLHSKWTEEQFQKRQHQFEAVTEARIMETSIILASVTAAQTTM